MRRLPGWTFAVPTATFRVLDCFFVIGHGRRRILRFNVTEHPTRPWIVQQRRDAFPEDRAPPYLVLDGDGKFSGEVATMVEGLGSERIRTAYRSPWQNGVAERIPSASARSSVEDRIHHALRKETPTGRVVERRPTGTANVAGVPRAGGLHHRYHGKCPSEV
jgi:putative transposase